MIKVVEPKVNVIDFGPKLILKDGTAITPDEFVYGAAGITYKDVGALSELIELKKNDVEIREKIKTSLIKSGGAGHASMATTPGMWIFLEGNCSKLVDSIFTGARFASSLMPSGRRIPITKDQIVVPRGIHKRGKSAENVYVQSLENCIGAYEKLQTQGVPKQEASKIVPYGHRGGGFVFMPMETLISISKNMGYAPEDIPEEGRMIVSQLEEFIHGNGMEITYEARKAAPREGCPNPNIFHHRNNLAQELIMQGESGLHTPTLLTESYIPSLERDGRIAQFLMQREELFEKHPENIWREWPNLLSKLDEIVQDYNNSIQVTTLSNSPWRVWGEVKRHRTLPQITEPIYHAVERANHIKNHNLDSPLVEDVFSLPESVKNEKENFHLWKDTFMDSLTAYNSLTKMGVLESDAIAVIPRGLKMGIVKTFDLFNLTTGYMSLRLCTTAEPEMRETTEYEKTLFLDSNMPEAVKKIIEPKCAYTGFCPDRNCGKVKNYVPSYDKEFHKEMQLIREKEIKAVI